MSVYLSQGGGSLSRGKAVAGSFANRQLPSGQGRACFAKPTKFSPHRRNRARRVEQGDGFTPAETECSGRRQRVAFPAGGPEPGAWRARWPSGGLPLDGRWI